MAAVSKNTKNYFESSKGVRHTQYNFSFRFVIPLLFEVAILLLFFRLRFVDVLPFDVVPTVGVVDEAACLVGVGIDLTVTGQRLVT